MADATAGAVAPRIERLTLWAIALDVGAVASVLSYQRRCLRVRHRTDSRLLERFHRASRYDHRTSHVHLLRSEALGTEATREAIRGGCGVDHCRSQPAA